MSEKLSKDSLNNYLISWKEWIKNLIEHHPRITKGSEWRDDDEQAFQQISQLIEAQIEPSTQMRIHCNECGKVVSTDVPKETIIRAWVECPECTEKRLPDPEEQLNEVRSFIRTLIKKFRVRKEKK